MTEQAADTGFGRIFCDWHVASLVDYVFFQEGPGLREWQWTEDGMKVVNRHIAEKDLPELQKQIEEREKYRKEILAYKKRMVYLEKLLKKPNREGGHDESAA